MSHHNYSVKIFIVSIIALILMIASIIINITFYNTDITSAENSKETVSPTQEKINFSKNNSVPISKDGKYVYLTFDDGPSEKVTPQILNILDKYNIKATFFVTGKNVELNPQILKEEFRRGHKIGNHSYNHDYEKIYSSIKDLCEEINKTNYAIDLHLDCYYGNVLFRFPGGSFERDEVFLNAIGYLGFKYVDWNCAGNDAVNEKKCTADEIVQNVIATALDRKNVVVLLHDSYNKQATVDALPQIIEYFQSKGYEFRKIED